MSKTIWQILRQRNDDTGKIANKIICITCPWSQVNFKDKPHYVIQVTYTLVRQRIGGNLCFYSMLQFLTWYFKQSVLLRGIFSLLKKTFIELTGNQNSNLKNENKTTQQPREP